MCAVPCLAAILQEAKKSRKAAAKEARARPKGEEGGDDDEDAINSDLDDDDEAEEEENADGAETRDFVCALYEKVRLSRPVGRGRPARQIYSDAASAAAEQVQRTKNKWKVTLKDGLISINGREYLFSKCAGYVSPLFLPLGSPGESPELDRSTRLLAVSAAASLSGEDAPNRHLHRIASLSYPSLRVVRSVTSVARNALPVHNERDPAGLCNTSRCPCISIG